MTTVLVVDSDTHTGSKVGLCPPTFDMGDGTHYGANDGQLWQFSCWNKHWDRVEKVAEQHRANEIWTVLNGDMEEKGSDTFEQITHNPTDLVELGLAVLQRPAKLATRMFFVRGTTRHVGEHGWLEEYLARNLKDKAVQDEETGNFSWWFLPMSVEGVDADFYHKPETRGLLPHTEDPAASRMSHILRERYSQKKESPPDLALYSHVHYFADSGIAKIPRVFYTRGWQLPYAWIHSIGKGAHPQPIGGLIVVIDGDKVVDVIDDHFLVKGRARWKK